jgi:hypothetical protein
MRGLLHDLDLFRRKIGDDKARFVVDDEALEGLLARPRPWDGKRSNIIV